MTHYLKEGKSQFWINDKISRDTGPNRLGVEGQVTHLREEGAVVEEPSIPWWLHWCQEEVAGVLADVVEEWVVQIMHKQIKWWC